MVSSSFLGTAEHKQTDGGFLHFGKEFTGGPQQISTVHYTFVCLYSSGSHLLRRFRHAGDICSPHCLRTDSLPVIFTFPSLPIYSFSLLHWWIPLCNMPSPCLCFISSTTNRSGTLFSVFTGISASAESDHEREGDVWNHRSDQEKQRKQSWFYWQWEMIERMLEWNQKTWKLVLAPGIITLWPWNSENLLSI